jgi:hypothetical protein
VAGTAEHVVDMNNTKIVVCNYRTLEHTKKCLESIRLFYPDINITVVDGSGYDDSTDWLYNWAKADINTTLYTHSYNIHHGPGMDMAIRASDVPYVFIMDSDAWMIEPNVIEDLLDYVKNMNWHTVGRVIFVNDSGLAPKCIGAGTDNTKPHPKCPYRYIHPFAALVNREVYLQYAPFIKHGAPCVETAKDLHNKGMSHLLVRKITNPYVAHKWAGTRNTYGIQL